MSLQVVRLGGLVVSLVSMVLAGCQHHEDPHTATPRPAQTYHLTVTNPSTGAMDEYVRTGTVISDQRLALSSQLTGYIREIRVQEGETIRQGQVLVRLESSQVEGAIQGSAHEKEKIVRQALTGAEKSWTCWRSMSNGTANRLTDQASPSWDCFRKRKIKHVKARSPPTI